MITETQVKFKTIAHVLSKQDKCHYTYQGFIATKSTGINLHFKDDVLGLGKTVPIEDATKILDEAVLEILKS